MESTDAPCGLRRATLVKRNAASAGTSKATLRTIPRTLVRRAKNASIPIASAPSEPSSVTSRPQRDESHREIAERTGCEEVAADRRHGPQCRPADLARDSVQEAELRGGEHFRHRHGRADLRAI